MLEIRTLYVELTSKCNLRCRYCYNESGIEDSNLNTEELLNFCAEAGSFWSNSRKEVFISGGEPLLHSSCFTIIEGLYRLGFNVYLVTNACRLTSEVSDMIYPFISGVQVSLDGSSKEIHDYFRGHGSYEMAVQNIRSLSDCMLKKIRARISIGKVNSADVIDFVDFCYTIGIAGVQFGLIRKQGRGCQQFEECYEMSIDEIYSLKKLIDKKRDEFRGKNFDVGIFDVEGGNCILSESFPTIDMRVDSKGNVYPCHSLFAQEFCMGNIYDSSVEEVIGGNKTKDILRMIKNRRETLSECSKCMWKEKICHGGCPAEAYAIHGDINHLDNKCALRGKFWRDTVAKRVNG